MTNDEYTELYNKLKEVLGDRLFVLILPELNGNHLMSNITQNGVSHLLIKMSSKFSPNKKVNNFLKSNE